jgi:hypothetical protein
VPAVTLEQAQAQLNAWLACSLAIATGNQSHQIGIRTFTKADAGEVREQIEFWERRVEQLQQGAPRGPRVRYVVTG